MTNDEAQAIARVLGATEPQANEGRNVRDQWAFSVCAVRSQCELLVIRTIHKEIATNHMGQYVLTEAPLIFDEQEFNKCAGLEK